MYNIKINNTDLRNYTTKVDVSQTLRTLSENYALDGTPCFDCIGTSKYTITLSIAYMPDVVADTLISALQANSVNTVQVGTLTATAVKVKDVKYTVNSAVDTYVDVLYTDISITLICE